MKRVNTILATILLLTGCGGNRQINERDDFVTVDVTKSYPKKELILQEFMDVEYIALETSGEFYCQGVVQAIGKEVIIVSNRVRDGDIFIFGRNGKGLRKINRMGRGGEEYQNITEITLDEDNNEMFINDASARKIMVYDLYGSFKRSLSYKEGFNYRDVFNFDKESLICRDNSNPFAFEHGTVEIKPPFIIISKQDGSIVNDIHILFEQKKTVSILFINGQSVSAMPTDASSISSISVFNSNYFPIISYHDSWILTESSSDTVFRFLPDCSMISVMARTPSIQSMNLEVFLFPRIFTDQYYLMETVKKEQGYPKAHLVYDRQEKSIHEYTLYNGDYSNKKAIDLSAGGNRILNSEIVLWQKIESDELVEDYEKGVLKSRLKEIAANLKEEDNPVIMLLKYKK